MADLHNGDLVELEFDPPLIDDGVQYSCARGEIIEAAGQVFIADTLTKSSLGQPKVLTLSGHPGIQLISYESAEEKLGRRKAAKRGDLVFPSPGATAKDLADQLHTLAEMIAIAPRERGLHTRKDELELQFHDIADHIEMARAKRTYLLARARVGEDFHPWTTRNPTVIRIETVRPIPADFEPTQEARRGRGRRLAESVRIFGEAERETRKLAAALRSAGYHVRRPHPQAQELLVRVEMGEARVPMRADMSVTPSSNGLWSAEAAPTQNKKEDRARLRMLREGHLERLRLVLEIFEPA